MEKGIKMTIKVSQEMLDRMTKGGQNEKEIVIFDQENGTLETSKNEPE